MVKSKPWNWEIVDNNDKLWNTPSMEIYYLCNDWKQKKFKTFLDIGCGYGRHSIFMANNGFDVSAFDLSQKSVDQTIQKAKEHNVKLKSVVVGDMLNMPYKDSSFDCMLAYHVIAHTDTKGFKKILKEIYRILKPNGEVYFTVGSKETEGYTDPINTVVDANTRINMHEGPEKGVPHFYMAYEDMGKMFKDFKIVEIRMERRHLSGGHTSSHYHVWLKK